MALGALGVPPLTGAAARAGVSASALLGVALAGGVVSTVGVLGVLAAGRSRAAAHRQEVH